MRRSAWLVAATAWLLALGACGDQPRPEVPRADAPRGTAAAKSRQHSHGGGAATKGSEPSENSEEIGHEGRAAEARRDPGLTSEQLAERYGKARALGLQQGSASYYSDAFAGRATASGVPYEPQGFTAAHRSLPFGSVLRVTRSDGGPSVYVRVTDRGPYGPRGRILDLSRAAAERLGMLRAGVVKIKLEVVEYGPRKPPRRRRR
jgi:rare lipoprotein A (peptidoglycan hydrolase)